MSVNTAHFWIARALLSTKQILIVCSSMGATLLVLSLLLTGVLCQASGETGRASTPPRGWNSYDSYSWIIDEQAFLQNAEILASRLLPLGYEYAVVDFLWYRKNVEDSSVDSEGHDNIDEWGRVIPDPNRWPSSKGGKGFTEVAQKVHDLGLKFGIHVMRGISTQAVNAKSSILDVFKNGSYEEASRQWTARDIGMTNMTCSWMQHGFMSVNTDLGAGKAFLRSLYRQYAKWGVDFVKVDCIFGDDLDSKEIITISELLEELDRPVLLSLSPGTNANPSMANGISDHVNMYRVTGDDWDKWEDVESHFDVARDFAAANKIGAVGLHGQSWPDLDMLPLGWLTNPGEKQGPHRNCSLTLDEQRTQVTLWAMAKSPLMFGGDLKNIDETTFNLIAQPTLLEINSYSTNNKEISVNSTGNVVNNYTGVYAKLQSRKVSGDSSGIRAWEATGRKGETYLSLFNLNSERLKITSKFADLCDCTEVWSGKKFGMVRELSINVEKHGCALFVLYCKS